MLVRKWSQLPKWAGGHLLYCIWGIIVCKHWWMGSFHWPNNGDHTAGPPFCLNTTRPLVLIPSRLLSAFYAVLLSLTHTLCICLCQMCVCVCVWYELVWVGGFVWPNLRMIEEDQHSLRRRLYHVSKLIHQQSSMLFNSHNTVFLQVLNTCL